MAKKTTPKKLGKITATPAVKTGGTPPDRTKKVPVPKMPKSK